MFNFNPDKINYDEELGTGQWGTVYPYQKSVDDHKWAVKYLVTPNSKHMLKVINEIVLGFSCDHPNVLPIKGYNISYEQKQKTWNIHIKIPRMKESLKDKFMRAVQENQPFSEADIIQYFYAIASGLVYLHNRKITHKDIKPENILIDPIAGIKIADIGIGELLDGETSYNVAEREGTILYSAPEVLDTTYKLKKGDLVKSDAWSLGVVMAELCLLKSRLVELSSTGEKKEADFARQLDQVQDRYSKDLIELIKSLLKANPKQRKTVKEVHSLLKERFAEILGKQTFEKGVQVSFEESKFEEEEEPVVAETFDSLKESILKKWGDNFSLKMEDNQLEIVLNNNAKLNENSLSIFINDMKKQGKKALENLEGLSLSLKECQRITDEHISKLAIQAQVNLDHLRALELDLSGCDQITDSSMQKIAASTARLTNLRRLDLKFFRCQKITDLSIKELAVQIGSNLINLQSLSLDFSECSNIKDSSVGQIVSQVGSNVIREKDLLILALYFSSCDGITDASLKALAIQMKLKFKNLQGLLLSFTKCEKITDQAVRDLALQISSNLKFLDTLSLYFQQCPLVKPESIQIMKSVFKKIPHAKIL